LLGERPRHNEYTAIRQNTGANSLSASLRGFARKYPLAKITAQAKRKRNRS